MGGFRIMWVGLCCGFYLYVCVFVWKRMIINKLKKKKKKKKKIVIILLYSIF